jgi:hypothetical protein
MPTIFTAPVKEFGGLSSGINRWSSLEVVMVALLLVALRQNLSESRCPTLYT